MWFHESNRLEIPNVHQNLYLTLYLRVYLIHYIMWALCYTHYYCDFGELYATINGIVLYGLLITHYYLVDYGLAII